jgi:putative ABC transport system permease protein
MRIRDYITIASKDTLRQPVRSSLTILALTVSTIILVTLLAITTTAKQTIIKELGLDTSLENIIVTPNQNAGIGFLGQNVQIANDEAQKLNNTVVDRLKTIPHVMSVMPKIDVWELKTFIIDGTDKKFIAKTVGVESSKKSGSSLTSGRYASTTGVHEVVLGYAYVKQLGYETNPEALVSKTIQFTTQNAYRGDGATIPDIRATKQEIEDFSRRPTTLTATIVGIGAKDVDENQLLISLPWARALKTIQSYDSGAQIVRKDTIEENGYSSIILRTDSTKNIVAVTNELSRQNFGFISTQQQIERIDSLTTIMWGVLGTISIISLVMASLGIINTMLITVSEQRYTIAVWRACGARRYTIMLRFLLQAGLLGLIGGMLGVICGWIIIQYVNEYIGNMLKAQHLPIVDVVASSPRLLMICVIMTVLFATIAGLYPAWRAAREDPSHTLTSQ